jgi:hypothetical protein
MKQRIGVIDAMVLSRYVHDDVPSRRPGLTKVPVLMCPTFLTWNVSNCTLLVCTFARLSTIREIEYQDHDPALGQKSGLNWPSSDELMLFA